MRLVKITILLWIAAVICKPAVFYAVEATDVKYIRVASLQDYITSYGGARAWNNTYYEGLQWPALYARQDNAVIKRYWVGCNDFTDENGQQWDKYCLYYSAGYVDETLFPVKLEQTAKFENPMVLVDGVNVGAPYAGDVDEMNPNQIADRVVTNVVNSSMGLTLTRQVHSFTQQYHDNYMITFYTYENTGNTDYDDEIELNQTLDSIYISWGTRYSCGRDGANLVGDGQVYGKHSWVTKRGENYADHYQEVLTESNPVVDWIRCGFEWVGQSDKNGYDNIGAPEHNGTGRLRSPHHPGVAVLHVDKSPSDNSDDPNQPFVLGWHAGDTQDYGTSEEDMVKQYFMISGTPSGGKGGNERMDELYMAEYPDPWKLHNDGGGTNIWVCYGPYTLAPGESVTIVEVEGVAGLSREMCENIGSRWKEAYDNVNDKGPFSLPDGKTTDDENVFKNEWVYTGKDSILLTFSRALRNYRADMQIPQPPQPPKVFQVISGGDRITLSWQPSPSETESGVAGYKIFRAVGQPDTTYTEIYDGQPGIYEFDDVTAIRGMSYYYYIVAYNDGSNNQEGITNPVGPLQSGMFYTRTTEPAYLRRPAGESLDNIRIVPNPYNIKARDLQYTGEKDKLMFLNIPGFCDISIYSVRGDLIETLHHSDGSGDQAWNLLTSSKQIIVSGVYIAYFEVTADQYDSEGKLVFKKGQNITKKFVVIR